jgi:hypothetical protein
MTQFWHMSAAVFLTWFINLPFGYWRASLKKLSFKWFLAIHLPIPFVVILRFIFHLGFQLYTYPFLITAFFLGQFTGARVYVNRRSQKK